MILLKISSFSKSDDEGGSQNHKKMMTYFMNGPLGFLLHLDSRKRESGRGSIPEMIDILISSRRFSMYSLGKIRSELSHHSFRSISDMSYELIQGKFNKGPFLPL